jgi:hypothetical protein
VAERRTVDVRYNLQRQALTLFQKKGDANLAEIGQIAKIADQLQEMLDSIKFGSITLVIQDGKIIQVEKHEKVRIK